MSESDITGKFKKIQEEFLNFLENEENPDENLNNLNQLFEDIKIRDCQHEFRLFLHMLVSISNNHHRGPNYFSKIKQILQIFKEDLKKYENTRILSLFKSNKRILLLLIEEKILTVDEYFVKQIIQGECLRMKYPQYFWPEIKPFMNEKWFPKYEWVEDLKKELPDNFYELRKLGENESFLSKLIRNDSVIDFIIYVNENKISLNAKIDLSIYETNSYFYNKFMGTYLIDYAAFYGADKIFRFLKDEGVKLMPSLWIDVIHGKNAELIHLLEDYNIEPTILIRMSLGEPITNLKNYRKKKWYIRCFMESIKCHHNDIANYFINKYLQKEDENSYNTYIQSLKYYNFSFMHNEHKNELLFCHLCYYDYYSLANIFFTDKDIDINSKLIQNHIFQ